MQRRELPIHGRGASSNPPNRFERLVLEPNPDEDGEDAPAPATQFYRDETRTVVTHNDSPDVGFAISVNPYRGCEHGCVYCLSGDTPVLMADGLTRPLHTLRVGDAIYGTVRRGWYRRTSRRTYSLTGACVGRPSGSRWRTDLPGRRSRPPLPDSARMEVRYWHRPLWETATSADHEQQADGGWCVCQPQKKTRTTRRATWRG
jgi:hypothetical protein